MTIKTHRVTPFLWYDGTAEEAANFYVSVFKKGSKVTSASPMSVSFDLEGQPFHALNGGPMFKFTEALSLFVDCQDQAEVDYYWDALSQGGQTSRCGWLKDQWGLSWQIVPRALGECLGGPDKEGVQRAMAAMLAMDKLDVQRLKDAYDGK
jgi:predicted 3-demethylubiquinone-9 3-methyltransferase (glyoxalase superfamily)